MEELSFHEVIDFAIKREEEAVAFYHELQKIALFAEKKSFLKELETMERGHIALLEQIRKGEIKKTEIPEIQDIHISDYIVESKPTKQMSYQDILIIAMKREEKSLKLYTSLAERSPDPDRKNLFQKIASEEAKHKRYFEEIYDEEILSEA